MITILIASIILCGIVESAAILCYGTFLKKRDRIKYGNVDIRAQYFINSLSSFSNPILSTSLYGYNYISTHLGILSKYYIYDTGIVLRWSSLHRKLKKDFKYHKERRILQMYIYFDVTNTDRIPSLDYISRTKFNSFKFGR